MAVTEITKYVASDWREFENRKDAEQYEVSLRIKEIFKKGSETGQISFKRFNEIFYENIDAFADYLVAVQELKMKQE